MSNQPGEGYKPCHKEELKEMVMFILENKWCFCVCARARVFCLCVCVCVRLCIRGVGVVQEESEFEPMIDILKHFKRTIV